MRHQGKRKEISLSEFTLGLKAIGFSASDEAAKSLFNKLDVNGDGIINYLEWDDYLAVDDLYACAVFTETRSVVQFFVRSSLSFLDPPFFIHRKSKHAFTGALPFFTEAERQEYLNLMGRLDKLAALAESKQARQAACPCDGWLNTFSHMVGVLFIKYRFCSPCPFLST